MEEVYIKNIYIHPSLTDLFCLDVEWKRDSGEVRIVMNMMNMMLIVFYLYKSIKKKETFLSEIVLKRRPKYRSGKF